ncbi:TPA: pilus assembly protein PilO [Klebsiella variicola subsp. variicola]|nr:pilus assembly protein PilO [Klebsiella variicola subsp. variicola]
MWISSRRSQAVLLTLLAMGGLGFGVTLWCAAGPPLAAVSRDPVLQTQWRRVMALRMPAGETPGGRIDKQPFSPIAIPLAGMNPRSFSLEREAQVLRLRLQLEAADGT